MTGRSSGERSDRTVTFDAVEYGAAGDGKIDDTDAIQRTIDACADRGGGRAVLPAGTYRSGTLYLRDDVVLVVSSGATLLGSDDLGDYDPALVGHATTPEIPEGERGEAGMPLLVGQAVRNAGLVGSGRIDGNGHAFWEAREEPYGRGYTPLPRPVQLALFVDCEDIRVEDVRIEDSPYQTFNFVNCDTVSIRNVTIRNDVYGPNTDGINVDGGRAVRISDCDLMTGGGDALSEERSNRRAGVRRVGPPRQDGQVARRTGAKRHRHQLYSLV